MAKLRLLFVSLLVLTFACADPDPAPEDVTAPDDTTNLPDVAGDEGPAATDEGPASVDEGTAPIDEGIAPIDEGSAPTDEGPAPTDEGPAPTDEGPAPTDEGPALTDEESAPVDEGSPAVDFGSLPTDQGVEPIDGGSPAVDFGDFPTDEGAAPTDLGAPSIDVGPLPTDEGVEPTDLGSELEDVPGPFEDLFASDVSGPQDTQVPIECADPEQVIDCDGNCISASFLTDEECQDGSIEFDGVLVNLKCSDFGCDSGACTGCGGLPPGECFDGQISDCDGNCVNSGWIGDDFCDDGIFSLANFACEEHEWDGCDCPGCEIIPGECLILGDIPDCDGNCFPISVVGDGICDNSEGDFASANFACEEHLWDGCDCPGCEIIPGECLIPGNIPDCDGNCANSELVGDGFCDDGSEADFFVPANFACEVFECDGGDCSPLQCGGPCVPLLDCATITDTYQCGLYPNGCGIICLTPGCGGGQVCNTDTGQCVDDCTADCSSIQCGFFGDGCGGICPSLACAEGDVCDETGQCVSGCVPECPSPASCAVLTDGCGGLCVKVDCGPLEFCNEDLGQCQPVCVGNCINECGSFDNGCGEICSVPGCFGGDVCNEEIGICEAGVEPIVGSAIISEYVEGSGSANKAIEVFNASNVDLDCVLTKFVNGNIVGSAIGGLISLPVNGLYVICNSTSGLLNDDLCDDTNGGVSYNGDDAITVSCVPAGTSTADLALHDVFGVIGSDPGTAWTGGGLSTKDQTLRRDCGITQGDTHPLDAFDPSVGWTGFPQNTVNDLGHHCGFGTPPICTPTCTNQCGTFDDGCGNICLVFGCGGGEICNEATGVCEPETPSVTTFSGVNGAHSVFAAKCGFCHTGGFSGGHSIGASDVDFAYTFVFQSVNNTFACGATTTKGECSLFRMNNGTMPPFGSVSADQLAIIQAWVDAGMPF